MKLCAKCARHERTCCQDTEILVTDGDIQRIRDHAGRSDFWEYRTPSDPEYLEENPGDPHWLWYTVRADGTRPVLKHKVSRDCTFLSPTGCSLPMEVRPLICRLYPYDYSEREIIGTVPGCPLYLLEKGQTMIEGVGVRLEDAKRWRRQLYSELKDGSVLRENRPDL